MKSLGSRQSLILSSLRYAGEGCSILELDRRTNSGPRHDLTYDSVHRLVRGGLIELRRGARRGTYSVYLTEAGR